MRVWSGPSTCAFPAQLGAQACVGGEDPALGWLQRVAGGRRPFQATGSWIGSVFEGGFVLPALPHPRL